MNFPLGYTSMRTNIDIDDKLMAEAMAASGLSTKRETVEAALRLLARRKRHASARALFGRVQWEGDLDAERRDDAGGSAEG
jgi:Arc/MetJ family transcription regulator